MKKIRRMDYRENNDKTQHVTNRTFEAGHIEHAMLDVFLECPNTNLKMGRPWLTLLTDVYSGQLLASYLSLEPPSYKSLEMTLQECIKKHSRLPNTIILKNRNEVYGTGLEDLVYKYKFNLEFRLENNSGYKSSIEKLFKSIDGKLPIRNKGPKFERMTDNGLDK